MKLEVGKSYRTRGGQKVTIASPILCDDTSDTHYRSEYKFLDSDGNAYMSDGLWHHSYVDNKEDLVAEWTDDDQYKADDNKTVDERSEEKILEQARKYAVHINSAIDAAIAMGNVIPKEYLKDWVAVNTLKGQKKLQVADPFVKRTATLKEAGYVIVLHGKTVDVGCVRGIPFKIIKAALACLTSGAQPTYSWDSSDTTGFAEESSRNKKLMDNKARSYREGIRWCGYRLSWKDADQLLEFLDQYSVK